MGLGRRIGISLGALFFAAILWSYVHLSTAYEVDMDLPVSLTSPKGLAIASGLPDRLHTRVKGAGWQILLMNFTHNSHFQLDLADRDTKEIKDGKLILHTDDLAHSAIMPSEVKLMKVDPDSLVLSFGAVVRKRIPIQPVLDIHLPSGYALVGTPKVVPEYAIVEGSSVTLDSLNVIRTKSIIVSDIREPVTKSIELSDSMQNELSVLSPGTVSVLINVQALSERAFRSIPVTVDAVPPEKEVLLTPSNISVTLRGGVDELAKLLPSDIHAHVTYEPIQFDSAQFVKPSVEVPNGITFLSSDPENLSFVVRKRVEPSATR